MREEQPFNQRLNDALKRNNLDMIDEEPIGMPEGNPDDNADINSGLAQGMRIGLEFMSGTIVGLALGYGVDSYFNTSPWGLLVLTILGFCAGLLNVYRSVNNIDEGIGINRQNGLTKRK